MAVSSTASKLLDLNRQFDIEYQDYLSNHLSQGIVALDRLNAPPHVLQAFFDHYSQRLEKARPGTTALNAETWTQAVGNKSRYTDLVAYFDREIEREETSYPGHGWQQVVSTHLPYLLEGMVGAAFHGLIQLGFGVDAQHPGMVAEGLAYLTTVYTPLPTPTPQQLPPPQQMIECKKLSPVEAMEWVIKYARETNLFHAIYKYREAEPYSKLKLSTFQRGVAVVLDHINNIGPQLLTFDLDLSPDHLEAAICAITELVALAYLHSDNDFFVLHGITSWHSLKVLLPLLKQEEDQHKAISHWFKAFVVAFVVQGVPGCEKLLEEVIWMRKQYGCEEKAQPRPRGKATEAEWRGLAEESFKSQDEHTFKVVYALFEAWKHYHHLDMYYDIAAKAAKDKEHFRFVSAP